MLATINGRGTARLVPICFAADQTSAGLVIYSAVDEKPKSVSDPRELARVHDIRERPRVTVLVDEWTEDWSALRWLRLEGTATLLEPPTASESTEPEHARAVQLLRARYPQYAGHALEAQPVIRIVIERTSSWSA